MSSRSIGVMNDLLSLRMMSWTILSPTCSCSRMAGGDALAVAVVHELDEQLCRRVQVGGELREQPEVVVFLGDQAEFHEASFRLPCPARRVVLPRAAVMLYGLGRGATPRGGPPGPSDCGPAEATAGHRGGRNRPRSLRTLPPADVRRVTSVAMPDDTQNSLAASRFPASVVNRDTEAPNESSRPAGRRRSWREETAPHRGRRRPRADARAAGHRRRSRAVGAGSTVTPSSTWSAR